MNTTAPLLRWMRGWKQVARRLGHYLLSNPERDSRFREEIYSLSRKGIRTGCSLGIIVVVIYMIIALVYQGRTPAWTRGLSPYVSILDKLLIVLIIGFGYAISFKNWGLRNARLVVGTSVVLVGLIEAIFDLVNSGNMRFTTPWLAIILLVGLGSMPFRFMQSLLLGLAMLAVYPLVTNVGPHIFAAPEVGTEKSQVIFMVIMVLLGAAISMVLYWNRYLSFIQREHIKETRDQLAVQAERLEHLDRIKARFFANLSHEFRTPLTLILGPVEDALSGHAGAIPARLASHLDIARRNGYRMKRLINQLLDLSSIEAGRMVLEPAMHDLVAFCRSLVGSFSAAAEAKELSFSFASSEETLRMAIDADKMEKMVTNLISNAIKFTPKGGKVHVNVSREGESALVSIKDTGPGLPEEARKLVFDRFYQFGAMAGDSAVGTGIGLALVKELVELHGGTITVESDVGFGSEFVLQIPIVVHASDELLTAAKSSMLTDGNAVLEESAHFDHDDEHVADDAPLVLIADDNDDVRTYLRSHLERHYRISEARDGDEAVQKILNEQPALILSDVMMPGLNGHEVCRLVKSDKRTNHIPVILITARASEESRREGLELGADDYLFKPFNADDLMLRVENLIEIRRVLRERYSGEFLVKPTNIAVQSAEAEFLEQTRAVVEEHIGDTNFGVDWLAAEVGLSARQLQRRLRASIGLSAAGYIRTLRLQRAEQLLGADAGNISEIAYRVGFMDANYFSRLFKQTFGTSPSEYEKPDEDVHSMN